MAKCGFNKEKFGGGMKVGCDKDYTKCDGKFNTETAKAVREFQKTVGITMDGLVGPKTLSELTKGQDPCLSPVKCSCKKKEPIKNVPGDKDKRKDLTPSVDIEVTVGCKKSMSCFEKHKKDACGLANCLGICIPDGMCKGQMLDKPKDKPVNDVDCKECPKYINEMPGVGVRIERTDKIQRCIDTGCTRVAV